MSYFVIILFMVLWGTASGDTTLFSAEPNGESAESVVKPAADPMAEIADRLLPPLPAYAISQKKWLDEPNAEEAFRNLTAMDFENEFLKTARLWQEETARFTVPDGKALQQAKTDIQRQVATLEVVFRANPVQGNNWRKKLGWTKFVAEIRKTGTPDIYILADTFGELCSGSYGLELECFASLRLSVQKYVSLLAVRAKQEETKGMFQRVCNMLTVLLAQAAKNPHADTQRTVEACLRWMDWTGQSQEAVKATRELWSKPNLLVYTTEHLFKENGTVDVQQPQKIHEVINQATVQGTSQFTGKLTFAPAPNDKRAEIRLRLAGTTSGSTVARSGPATVNATSTGTVEANKSIYFDSNGFSYPSARANITLNSQIRSVNTNSGRAQNAAWRRAQEQRPNSEREMASRQSNRLQNRMNQNIDPRLKKFNDTIYKDIRNHLEPRGLRLNTLKAWSDEKQIHIQSFLTSHQGLMAANTPTPIEVPGGAVDFVVAVHESSIQNVGTGYLSGLLLDASASRQLRRSLPKWAKRADTQAAAQDKSEEGEPPAIGFSTYFPVTATFADDKITLYIYGKQFINKDTVYPALLITVTYRVVKEDERFFLVRDGDFVLLPPNFDPASGEQISSSVTTIRRVMTRRLKEITEERVEIKPISAGQNEKPAPNANSQNAPIENMAMNLKPVAVKIENGWFQIAYKGESVEEKKTP